jgi:hypothetical protein
LDGWKVGRGSLQLAMIESILFGEDATALKFVQCKRKKKCLTLLYYFAKAAPFLHMYMEL